HDTASAVAAVPAEDERFAYLSSGTWSLMGIELPAPVMTAESARLNFTNEGGIDGTTRFLKNITGMWLLEQCRKVWKAQGRDYSYAELVDMARAEAAFPARIAPDDPRFANPADMVAEIMAAMEISPRAALGRNDSTDCSAREISPRAALGRNDSTDCHFERSRNGGVEKSVSDAQVVSCIYHSLADRYREVLEMLRGFAPFPIERLHIIGGGSANDLLNQWTADALGIPVLAGPTEATAIGNLMMQARAAGLVADRWEMRRLIARSFPLRTFTPTVISSEAQAPTVISSEAQAPTVISSEAQRSREI
ncbi:MAG: hypothetical protein K6F42_06020, partial [Bacteroidales bacterium]|nr:hypothetical protein [Bacteroidales bacterium]